MFRQKEGLFGTGGLCVQVSPRITGSQEFCGVPTFSHINVLCTQCGSDFGVLVLNKALAGS